MSESGFEVFMEYGPIVFAGPIVLASQREEFWHSYVVYPQEAPRKRKYSLDELLEGMAQKEEWGWYAPIVEVPLPEPAPRPTLGEIWGKERWGK